MASIVFFSTCLAVATVIERQTPAGLTLRRLQHLCSETEPFDFSRIHFVANIDPNKISAKEAIHYLLSECSEAIGQHYFEVNGRRFSIHDTHSIYSEAEKFG